MALMLDSRFFHVLKMDVILRGLRDVLRGEEMEIH